MNDTDVLWRYLSLDKFIDLVESKTLFFAPLAWYAQTDPFEGYLPPIAMDAMASIANQARDQHREAVEKLVQMLPERARPDIRRLREGVETLVPTMRDLHKNIVSCLTVNCWYKSEHESEGMWGLYSKGGVAIRTSVGAIRSALVVDEQNHAINIGAIKYVDFSDRNVKPSDCVTEDGQLIGMIKRVAYAHEKEVRMYISPERESRSLELKEPAPLRVSVDVEKLLEGVVISPFAGESIVRGVRAICRWGQVDESIVSKSNLLENCEYLLDAYQ
ncbi:DUF2971 domain-containing protein [Burkholderia orbicola]|uniref:DUF2971 domain-containing protein n=1 Tax=Burkholderia orbicola TaxID=2978683 RepID=UPI0035C68E17